MLLPGQQLGPFTIHKEIGSGAMGAVYRARYTKNDADVAIKVIALGLDSNPNTIARFERETTILKELDHPNIVRLFGSGRYHKAPFYIMEFIEGESLDKVLERRGRLDWEEVVQVGKQICAALKHAHDKGIIHRDLKPANIMMMGDGTAKLTDFGIAKSLEGTQLTATNSAVGTAAYMSPEQCRGEKNITPKSDLYSLGVLLYELATGRLPFTAETALDMFLAHTEGSFQRPARVVLDIPIWMDTLICHLMEKDPLKRPFDAATVSQALDQIVEKVAAQRSIGVDAVNARAIDRPKTLPKLDEADKEAARALKAGTSRTKLKRPKRPPHERGWVQATAIVGLLGAVAAIIYAATRPPKADQLYDSAARLMASANEDEWKRARDGPIADFLRYYPQADAPHADAIRAWADRFDLALRERQLRNRLKMNISPDEDAERAAQGAVRCEDSGDRPGALERWQSLQKLADSGDPDQRVWGLLANKRVADLKTADDRERRLSDLVEEARNAGPEYRPASEPERQAVTAARAEFFGDLSLGLERWQRLKDSNQANDAARPWFVLAAGKVAELTPKAARGADEKKARTDLLVARMEEAKKARADNPEDARAIYLDVVALYESSPDSPVREFVARARRELMSFPKREKPPARRSE